MNVTFHAPLVAPTELRDSGADATPWVREAVRAVRAGESRRIMFPPGRYDFFPDRAEETYAFVSNNDESLKRIAFRLDNLDGLEIEGDGALFMFHGLFVPFRAQGASNLRLSGFAIDWARPFFSEGHVIRSDADAVDVFIPEHFPFVVRHDRICFRGPHGMTHAIGNILAFDGARRETAFMARDHYGIEPVLRAESIGPRQVRLRGPFHGPPRAGEVLVFKDTHRLCPAIILDGSSGVLLEDIVIHHAGGMGVIAQHSRDLTLRRMAVRVADDSSRMISASADATHFVNCAGVIRIEDSVFLQQMDDASNIHGIYARVEERRMRDEVEIRLMHPQQAGVDLAAPGDIVEFVHGASLQTVCEVEVAAFDRLNKERAILRLARALPADIGPGFATANLTRTPSCVITGCEIARNRARGLLISTPGRVQIERNRFHTPGAAILIAGDANSWYESGGVRDVRIAHNTFDTCKFGVWGRAVIDIKPEIAPEHRGYADYHRGICVEDNRFIDFGAPLLRAECVNGLVFRRNTAIPSDAYPQPAKRIAPIDVEDCRETILEEAIPCQADAASN